MDGALCYHHKLSKHYIFSTLFFSLSVLSAQTQWTRIDAAFPPDIVFPTDVNRLCATSRFLTINLSNQTYLLSTDQGRTWQSNPIPGAGRGDIFCTGTAAWTTTQFVNNVGLIQKSVDGRAWDMQRLSPSNAQEINSALGGNGDVMITRRAYNIAGANARVTLQRSVNGGQSWDLLSDQPYVIGNGANQNLIAPLTASALSSLQIPFIAESGQPKALDVSTSGAAFTRTNFGTGRALFAAVAATDNYSFFTYADADLRAGVYRVNADGRVTKVLAGVPLLNIATSGRRLLVAIKELNSANTPTTAPVLLNHPRIFFSNDEGDTWWDVSAGLPRLAGTNSTTLIGFGFADASAMLLTGPAELKLGLYTITNLPTAPGPIVPASVRTPRITGVSLVASGAPGVTRGHYVSIYGEGFATTTRSWTGDDFLSNYLPGQLDNLGITVRNAGPTYPVFISPNQINIFVPLAGNTAIPLPEIQLTTAGGETTFITTDPFVVSVSGSISYFRFDPQNRRYIAAVTPGGDYLGPAALFGPNFTTRPARAGEIVTYFITGPGLETDGGRQLNPAPVQIKANCPVMPMGITAATLYYGLISPGVYQCNIRLTDNATPGDYPLIPALSNGPVANIPVLGPLGYLVVGR